MLPVGLLLVGGALGCGQKPRPGGPGEDALVAAIERLGGRSFCDERRPGRPIVEVFLTNTQVTDAELEDLGGLATLERLLLEGTQITDTGLEHLR